jgi:hypothetical protein
MVNCTDPVASQAAPLSWLIKREEERTSYGYAGHVRYWLKADILIAWANVRFRA